MLISFLLLCYYTVRLCYRTHMSRWRGGDQTAGPMCIYLHQTTTTSLLHSFICRPHIKSNISLSINYYNFMSTHFSLVGQAQWLGAGRSPDGASSSDSATSMSTHFSLVGQAQWLGEGRSPDGASSSDGATSMPVSFSSTPLPLSHLSLMRARAPVRRPAATTAAGRTLASPPGLECGRPCLLQLRARPRPPPIAAAGLARKQDMARGRRLVLPHI
jgi:hypothetical protein